MLQRLPVRVDPFRLAETERVLKGGLEISKMPRLSKLAKTAAGRVECELRFHKMAGDSYLSGRLESTLRLTCQRCLEDFDLPVTSEFSLLLVESDAMAERVQEYAEPLIIENDELDIANFIEDELLLSIPGIPRHEDLEACHGYQLPEATDTLEEPEKQNPFAVLEQLKEHEK